MVRPSTVALLFTDIESSTALLEELRDAYADLLKEHRRLLTRSFRRWDGRVVDTQGDSFFAVFPSATQALGCAIEAQRELQQHRWPKDVTLRVRMGLHIGQPLRSATGYIGLDVHRAARVAASAHGGQILVSSAAAETLAATRDGVELQALGVHRFKGLSEPLELYQASAPGLLSDFPPIRTAIPDEEPPAPGEPPYRGLRHYDEADAVAFFGREQLSAEAAAALLKAGFVALVGASGSGKSSVLRAGVVPVLTGVRDTNGTLRGEPAVTGAARRRVMVLTPTASPMSALERAMPGLKADRAGSVLAVDQLEELFTLCRDDAARAAFVDALVALRAGGTPVAVTLRADFYAHLAAYPSLRDAVAHHQLYLGPMEPDELRRAVEEPARLGGWQLAPGLVDLLLRDIAGEPGALPLLSHALLETWHRRRGHALTLKGYFESGEVRGAIAKTADRVYEAVDMDERLLVRDILLRLTEPGEGTQDTRRRVAVRELLARDDAAGEERAERVLQTLVAARLVTVDEGAAEVAHEALIREWPRLREWLTEDREALRVHRRVTEAAAEWEEFGRDAGLLYRGARLAEAREWMEQHPADGNRLEREFVDTSTEAAEREATEREAQRRRELEAARRLAETESSAARRLRRRALFLAGALATALLAGGAALFLGWQAQREATVARARELAAAAVANLDVDPERSILLALEGMELGGDGPVLREVEEALHGAVQASRILRVLPSGGAAAFSPDGAWLAVGGDREALVYAIDGGGESIVLTGHEGPVLNAAYDPNGRWIATNAADGTTRIWGAEGGEPLHVLPAASDVIGIAFSPDGRLLARSTPEAGLVDLFDPETGSLVRSLSAPDEEEPTGIDFSPDGTLVAAAGAAQVTVWEVASGDVRSTIPGSFAVGFSPDGELLVVGDAFGSAAVSTLSGERVQILAGHRGEVSEVGFSPDGSVVATGGVDGTVVIWDTNTWQQLVTLHGHTSSVLNFDFAPTRSILATASADGTARIWDIGPNGSREWLTIADHPFAQDAAFSPDGTRIAIVSFSFGEPARGAVHDAVTGAQLLELAGHEGPIRRVEFSPDGAWIATAGFDGTARIWDATNGSELRSLPGAGASVGAAAFSPDGGRVALAGEGAWTVWDTDDWEVLREVEVEAPTTDVDWSPDGTIVATAHLDGLVHLWQVATGDRVRSFEGHGGPFPEVFEVDFAADGSLLATGSWDGTVRIWDATNGSERHRLTGHSGEVWSVAFNPDGDRLASVAADTTIKIWDPATGQELLSLGGHRATVMEVGFSPDGRRLVTVGQDETVRVYALDIDDLARLARERLTRSFSEAECRQYLHLEACREPAESVPPATNSYED